LIDKPESCRAIENKIAVDAIPTVIHGYLMLPMPVGILPNGKKKAMT
jgi:hypothetical protein